MATRSWSFTKAALAFAASVFASKRIHNAKPLRRVVKDKEGKPVYDQSVRYLQRDGILDSLALVVERVGTAYKGHSCEIVSSGSLTDDGGSISLQIKVGARSSEAALDIPSKEDIKPDGWLDALNEDGSIFTFKEPAAAHDDAAEIARLEQLKEKRDDERRARGE